MKVVVIAAVAANGCIGKGGDIPWNIPEDKRRFSKLTKGHVVVMGKKTYLSLPPQYRPLKNRLNLVVTTTGVEDVAENLVTCPSIPHALHIASEQGYETVFLMGGERIYKEGLGIADELEITHVRRNYDGDVFFPFLDHIVWQMAAAEEHGDADPPYAFVQYKRR